MLSASSDQRRDVSTKLRDLLVELSDEAGAVCDEAVGCVDETLTTDQHQLEIVLLSQVSEMMALLKAYRVERDRLAACHTELLAEIDIHDRADSRLGYGHLQAEMV